MINYLNQFSRNQFTYSMKEMKILSKTIVGVFGLGGGGCYIAEHLARTGIGGLLLCDNDKYDITNINRQLCATHETIGKSKVDIVADRVLSINPQLRIIKCGMFATDTEPSETELVDIISDTVDGFSNKLKIESLSINFNKPLITGGLSSDSFWVADISNRNISLTDILNGKLGYTPSSILVALQASFQAQFIINNILDRPEKIQDSILTFRYPYGLSIDKIKNKRTVIL